MGDLFIDAQHAAAHRGWSLIQEVFPKARKLGNMARVGNLEGEVGQSLAINIATGQWYDHATGQKGGDYPSLIAAARSLTQQEAASWLLKDAPGDIPPTRTNGNGHHHAEDQVDVPPEHAPTSPEAFRHSIHGIPHHVHPYHSASGRLLFVVARYELDGDKQFCPWRWIEGRWQPKAWPAPRPLYGLPRLEQPGKVMLVEGERVADRLQEQRSKGPVVTWAGGARSWSKSDWEPLAGRSVILWPDADEPGRRAMAGIAGLLLSMACTLEVVETADVPEKHDAVDIIQAGNTGTALNAWVKARLRPIERPDLALLNEVRSPESIAPAVTVDSGTGRVLNHGLSVRSSDTPAAVYDVGLTTSKQGPHCNMANVATMLRHRADSGEMGVLWWDEFLQRPMLQEEGKPPREWEERDTLNLVYLCQTKYMMRSVRKTSVEDGLAYWSHQRPRNIAREWLDRLQWDGVNRLQDLMIEGFGAERNEYTQSVGRCFLVGLVARTYRPGAKVDTLPVLEGPQGINKSRAVKAIGGEWHTEIHTAVGQKDFYIELQGKWLVEISEFGAFRHADVNRIKGIVSNPTDRYRIPFERRANDHPRQCVFIATTNDSEWNIDDTGARRFWPIRCGKISVEWILVNRAQLFAEAVARLKRNEPWWDVPAEHAKIEQGKRRRVDVIDDAIYKYTLGKERVYMYDVLLSMDLKGVQSFDRAMQTRVGIALKRLGFERDTAVTDATLYTRKITGLRTSRLIDVEFDSESQAMALADPVES